MSLRTLLTACAAMLTLATSGCASYQAIETTPEGIIKNIEPGDTVRVYTRERGELTMLVTALTDSQLRGRIDGDETPGEVLWLEYDDIRVLEVQQLDMRRTLLTVVLPVIAGAIVACNNDDCDTRSVLDARF